MDITEKTRKIYITDDDIRGAVASLIKEKLGIRVNTSSLHFAAGNVKERGPILSRPRNVCTATCIVKDTA